MSFSSASSALSPAGVLAVRCSASAPPPHSVKVSSLGLSPASQLGQASLSLKADPRTDCGLLSSLPCPPLSFGEASPSAPEAEACLGASGGALASLLWSSASNVFNTQILVRENESTESVVRRFKKVCMDANIVSECRRRRYFETTQDIVKRKAKENARKRKRFQRGAGGGPRPSFFAPKDKEDAQGPSAASAADDDEAEWASLGL